MFVILFVMVALILPSVEGINILLLLVLRLWRTEPTKIQRAL